MENIQDVNTIKFLAYWEHCFKLILNTNTNWNRLFLTLENSSIPKAFSLNKFCSKYSKDFNVNIHYSIDKSKDSVDLLITK